MTRDGFLLNDAFLGETTVQVNERAPTDFAPAVVYNDVRPCQRRFAVGQLILSHLGGGYTSDAVPRLLHKTYSID